MNNSDRLELQRAVTTGGALSAGREVTIAGSLTAVAAVEAAVRTTADVVRIDRARQTSALLNHHIQQSKPVDDDDHEIGLLWLPYFIFTIVLLGLIALSFVRFHCQRGEQYRKRQEELEDKMPMEGNVMNGREGAPPLVPDVPDHLSLFVQFTQGSGRSSPYKVNPYPLNHPRWPPVVCRSNDSDGHFQTSATTVPSKSQKASSVDGLECGRASGAQQLKMKQQKSSKSSLSRPGFMTTSKHPLLFTFNVNGSMVDIRCGEEERSNTFRLASRRSVACTADTLSATSVRATSAASATYSATSAASNTGLIVPCALADDDAKTLRYAPDFSPPPRDAVFYSSSGYNTYNLNKKQFYANNNMVVSRGSPVGSSFYYVNSMTGQAALPLQQQAQLSERYHQSGRTILPPASVDGYPCTLAQGRYTEVRRTAPAGGDRWSDNDSLLRQNVESSS